MSRKINVALVGISGYGEQYLDSLLFDPRAAAVNFVGVADRAPNRCIRLDELQARRIAVHDNLPNLLAAVPVELLMIATPIHLHAPHACLAANRGASVMCEKPLAGSWRDAQRLLACERAFKGFIGIGYQWSYCKPIQDLKHDIMAGLLGKPVKMKSLVSFPRGYSYFARNDWAGKIRTAGGEDVIDSPVNNAAAHYLHNMLYLLGETRETAVTPAAVQAELYRANAIENYDTAFLRITTGAGTEVLFYATHSVAERIGPKTSLEFENATVTYDFLGSGTFVAQFRDGTVKNYGNPNLDRNEKIWHAVEAVHTGRPLPCTVKTAIPHTMCSVAAQRATIHEFPESLRGPARSDDDQMVVVHELQDTLTECYNRELLPSEMRHVSWAGPSETIDFRTNDLIRQATESGESQAVPA
ncbi:MAG TPA: Gfo/Idh/MocA family oxidoreductase [Tepidisphaeraceae bacterium]|nr:Gfo/Idh/MocA family oxidoreductase [Tepidisphaeraceae bacterium]